MQPGILADVPAHARFLTFQLRHEVDPRPALRWLAGGWRPELVVGVGVPLVAALGGHVPGLRLFPSLTANGFPVPATSGALWVRVAGADPGDVFLRGRQVAEGLSSGFELEDAVDGYFHGTGRDLSGYEDGTENPKGEDAEAAAIVRGVEPGMDGGSFLATQRWRHDFGAYERMSQDQRDDCIGRRQSDNEELEEAPISAHVKRTAQESFEPPAFLVRRSMPWHDARGGGLLFVAFATSLDPFERQLRRMVGAEDGVVDALFRFTRPETGATWFCPPVRDGLDLRAVMG